MEPSIEEISTTTDTSEFEHITTEEEVKNTQEDNANAQNIENNIHQKSEAGATISSQGSNNNITIHYYQNIIKESQQTNEKVDTDDDDLSSISSKRLITNNLHFARLHNLQFNDKPSSLSLEMEAPPANEETLSIWYHNLDEYTQCYVQTVAILHGTTIREIYTRTDMLYKNTQREKLNYVQLAENKQEHANENLPPFVYPRHPGMDIQRSTWTISRREKSAERIFWQDVNPDNGQTIFGQSVLNFLAKELSNKGEHWQYFYSTIREWSKEKGECSWRATRALGSIFWNQDIIHLQKLTKEWASRKTLSSQRLATSLINGAFEAEKRHNENIKENEKAEENNIPISIEEHSEVLSLLNEWTGEFHQVNAISDAAWARVNTVANTYALLGQSALDITFTLKKLNDLFLFKDYNKIENAQKLTATITSAYTGLALSGQVRMVLTHLASLAGSLICSWEPSPKLHVRNSSRAQQKNRLKSILDAFFLIVAGTASRTSPKVYSSSIPPLPEIIPLPDLDQRDVFLVAILTEDTLVDDLLKLLCAAIIEKRSKIVFEILYQWVSSDFTSCNLSTTNREKVIDLMVTLYQLVEQWSNDRCQKGYRRPVALEAYKHQLQRWSRKSITLDKLVHDILDRIS